MWFGICEMVMGMQGCQEEVWGCQIREGSWEMAVVCANTNRLCLQENTVIIIFFSIYI